MRLSVVALVLTVLGTVVDLQVGRWAAGFFGLPLIEVHHGLMALWIAPSFGLLLLFPMLPLLTAKGNGEGKDDMNKFLDVVPKGVKVAAPIVMASLTMDRNGGWLLRSRCRTDHPGHVMPA